MTVVLSSKTQLSCIGRMSSPNLPIRLGVIGLSTSGGWAKTLLSPILDKNSSTASKYKITALATRSAESAIETAKEYSQELGYEVKAYYGPSGAQDIARDPNVDLVVVTVKVGEHKAAVLDRKSTRLNSSHSGESRMPSSA